VGKNSTKSEMKENFILEKIETGMKECNAFIAQEITSNIEKFGIPPVLAIKGKIKNLKPKALDLSELGEFLKLAKKYGYQENDFCVLEDVKTKLKNNKTILLSGCLICICKKSGKVKEYDVKQGQSWIKDFGADLKNKFFSN
jgi:hypothetical protein